MAARPSLRESLGLPTRVEAPLPSQGGRNSRKMSGLGAGGSRPSTSSSSSGAAGNRRRTQVLSKPSATYQGQGSHKRSSVYGHGAPNQPKKDTRPLSDKSYQLTTIKKLITFLVEKNYGKAYTPKQLQHPSTKEFLHIFNFLVMMIDPSLEVNGMTLVEDIPKTLKSLGYPFTVSKNHMLNVGSPHSWPILLGALSWLVDCCSIPDRSHDLMFPSESGFNDGTMTDKEKEMEVEFYMYQVYLQYGHDSQEYQDLVQQKNEAKRRELEDLRDGAARLRNENEELERAIAELSKSSIPVMMASCEENKQNLATEEMKVEKELPEAIAEVEEEVTRLQGDQSELEMQILSTEEKCKELEDTIRHQPISAKDARELRQSISDAEHEVEKHRQMQRESMARIEELQIQHNRSVGFIDTACATANSKLHRLAALLPDAASLPPLEYDTSRRADPEVLQRLVSQAKKLRHEVHTLHGRVAARLSDLESRVISGESTLSTMENEMMRKQLENDNLQHTLDIEKTKLDQQKKKLEEAMKTEQAEVHTLKNLQRNLEERVEEGPRKKQELDKVKQQFEEEVLAMARELEDKDREYEDCVIRVSEVVELVKQQNMEWLEKLSEIVEEFKTVKIPAVPPEYLP